MIDEVNLDKSSLVSSPKCSRWYNDPYLKDKIKESKVPGFHEAMLEDHDTLHLIEVDCLKCEHFDEYQITCTAYPEGIPQDIIEGKVHHDKSYPGDNGILFKKRTRPLYYK